MPLKVMLWDNYVQLDYLGSNDILENHDEDGPSSLIVFNIDTLFN